MSSSNILSLPFRTSTHLSLSTPIRQYISKKYDQHPDMFRQDLQTIDTLRREAISVCEAHPSGIKRLQKYAGQLVWASGKFPIDIGADFTWYPALGYHTDRPLVQNNVKYELMNVLYNLAALYSQLAVSANRSTTDGLKQAANYFSQTAGVLTYMKNAVLPELRMTNPPEDMDEPTLESLTQLTIAQSQECFWQKAVMDGYKDVSIAKLAAKVSDLYNDAREAAERSEAIPSLWIRHMSAKHHHFAAAAQYRASMDCLERRRYGEEIARLQDALACVNHGLVQVKGSALSPVVPQDLAGLKRQIEETLKRAERDNDVIYLNPVPPKSELKTLERASMAVARIPPQVSSPLDYMSDGGELGPPLFAKLVPFAIHVAVSIYDERRDRLVNQHIIHQLDALTEHLHESLSALNIPGALQALEKPLGLPGTLVQHCEEIRQGDSLNRLQASFADIDKLRANDWAVFEEARSLLIAEQSEDESLRRKYGTDRWVRPAPRADLSPNGGAKLWNQVAEYEGYFGSSVASDGLVREKFAAIQEVLALLAAPERTLLDYVPSSRRTEIPDPLKPALGRLRGAYKDICRFESRRQKRIDALREKAQSDDVRPDITREATRLERAAPGIILTSAQFEDLVEARLDRLYEQDMAQVERETAEQEKALADVARINREFQSQKKAAGSQGNKAREAALQRLDDAYFKYKEIVSNIETGRKFYNDLSKIVEQFREHVRAWVKARRQDARILEDEICLPPLSSLSLNSPKHVPSPIQQQQQFQPAAPAQQLSSFGHHRPSEPPAQPWPAEMPPQQPLRPEQLVVATRPADMWTPEIGIRFASTNSPAAMPAAQPQPPSSQTWNPQSGIRFG